MDKRPCGVDVSCIESMSPFDLLKMPVVDGQTHAKDQSGGKARIAGWVRYEPEPTSLAGRAAMHCLQHNQRQRPRALMDYSAGLDLIPDDQLRHVLPPQVAAALPAAVRGFMVSDDASDTAACAAKYGIPMEDCANTIVVRYRKAGQEHYAAVVTLGSRRIDVNGALKATLQAQRISFASREFVIENSGMEYGGVTVFGLPPTWAVVVDEAVLSRTQIVMGAGIRAAKLLLSPSILGAAGHVSVSAIAA